MGCGDPASERGTAVAVRRHVVERQAQVVSWDPADASPGAQRFVVRPWSAIESQHIEDGVSGVQAWPESEHVFLSHPWSGGDGEGVTDGEGVEGLVDCQKVRRVALLKRRFQGGEAAGSRPSEHIAVAIKVSSTQHGAQQVFPREAGLQAELQIVVEACRSEALVVLIREGVGGPHEPVGPQHERRQTAQLGGGGEGRRVQFPETGLHGVRAALEDGQFRFEFPEQTPDGIRRHADLVQASLQQIRCFDACHGCLALVRAIGLVGAAAVLLVQLRQRPIGPVLRGQIHPSVEAVQWLAGFGRQWCQQAEGQRNDQALAEMGQASCPDEMSFNPYSTEFAIGSAINGVAVRIALLQLPRSTHPACIGVKQ